MTRRGRLRLAEVAEVIVAPARASGKFRLNPRLRFHESSGRGGVGVHEFFMGRANFPRVGEGEEEEGVDARENAR